MDDKKKGLRNEPDNRARQPTHNESRNKKNEVLPEQVANRTNEETGSMSEGNLTNERLGRVRTRTPHEKTFISGTDDDGQAV
jgi:hypothetical protein